MTAVLLQKSTPSVYKIARYDPTRTLMLRNAYSRDMNNRFNTLVSGIRTAVVDQDCFGLSRKQLIMMEDVRKPDKEEFSYPRSKDKITAFMEWLDQQVASVVLQVYTGTQLGKAVEQAWQNKYLLSAYQRGILRARQELSSAGYAVPSIEATGGVNAAMMSPFHVDRVGLIYTRAYSELKGITATMDQQISRVLAQGMAEGRNPREIARLLTRTITGPVGDLSLTDTLGRFIPAARRAQVLARTEVIRAHHVATIQEYRNWKAVGVIVKAEWITAEDDRVCDECDALQNKVFELDEIEGMIPYHPQCRCVAIPLDVTDEARAAASVSSEESGGE